MDKSAYLARDTICALATPVGGALAVVRVSGPGSLAILRGLCGKEPGWIASPRRVFRCSPKETSGRILDDSLAVFFEGAASFTGEDSFELFVHGGSFVVSNLLAELKSRGARPALPGEFSFRAVRNGKMSVTQAEAVADLIAAANTGAVDLALEKLSGSQNRLLTELAEELRQLATLGEVGIDFADQDIEEVGLPRLKQRASVLVEKLRRLGDSFQRGSRLQDGVPVAFVGLPNAGKSSFFNALLGEDRSIVSEVAGTTRDLVRERLTLQGPYGNVTLRLEDTAGLRASGDLVESMGIARSRKAASNADLLILVVDASSLDSRSLEDLTGEWRQLGSPSAKTLGILAKKDRVSAAELEGAVLRLQSLGLSHWHGVSSLSGEGVAEAGSAIAEACQSWVRREAGEVLLTRFDQLEAVRAAVAHLERALAAMELDLFASDLRQALLVLSSLIGDTLPDDILGRVFSQFCIGK